MSPTYRRTLQSLALAVRRCLSEGEPASRTTPIGDPFSSSRLKQLSSLEAEALLKIEINAVLLLLQEKVPQL